MLRETVSAMCAVLCLAAAPRFAELRRPPATQAASPAVVAVEVTNRDAWEARRAELRKNWQQILGDFPPRVPLETQVISTEELPDHTRLLVRYQSDEDTKIDAYVLIPKGFDGPRPGMVTFHPTSKTTLQDPVGLANRECVHFALHLVRRGYVCIAPRNFIWEKEGETWQQAANRVLKTGKWKTCMARMVWDAIRATDVLLERPEVDPKRVGTIGHSLGGKEALYHAAFDERIVAAISCEGGVGLPMSNWDADWYLGKQTKSRDFAHDNQEVMALIAPRALLIVGGEAIDGAKSWPYVEAALPPWRLFDAEDRIGLLRHTEKHNFPSPGPERDLAYSWLDHWLKQ